MEIEERRHIDMHMENFQVTPRARAISEARVKNKLDKSIEDHIIVCGVVKGIKNLILPLRTKC